MPMVVRQEVPASEPEAEMAELAGERAVPAGAGYESLLQTSVRPSVCSRRAALGAGLSGLLLAAGLLAAGARRGAPSLRAGAAAVKGALLGEQELAPQCTGTGANCIKSRCCQDSSTRCYAKDVAWAVCKSSCEPGIDTSEAEELQTPWSCAVLRPVTQCSGYGENCTNTKCCKDPNARCYYKDPGWAECRVSCIPGAVHEDEPRALRTPWSCVVAGSAEELTMSKPRRSPVAQASSSLAGECAKPYGNCTDRKCCSGQGLELGCFKRDAEWSECRESCPKDDRWECSKYVTIDSVSVHFSDSTDEIPEVGPPVVADSDGRHSPTLYCFSLMLPWGNEVSLIRTQLAKGVGIFACDDWSVLSNTSVVLSPGPPTLIRTDVLVGSLKCEFGGEYHTALNSEIFYRAWSKVFQIGRFSQYDWTAKMDPDAVLLPGRLRQHIANRDPTDSLYINNCFEGLHGPIEVVSLGGMKVFSDGVEHCRKSLEAEWMTYGEDVWLRRCFGLLSLARVDDYDVLREKACKPFKNPIPCTYNAVSFHPLKTPKAYFACLTQAMAVDADQPEG